MLCSRLPGAILSPNGSLWHHWWIDVCLLVGDVTSDRRSDAGDPFLLMGDRHDAMLLAVGWNYPHWVLTKVDSFGGFLFFLVALLFFAAGAVGGGGVAVDASSRDVAFFLFLFVFSGGGGGGRTISMSSSAGAAMRGAGDNETRGAAATASALSALLSLASSSVAAEAVADLALALGR